MYTTYRGFQNDTEAKDAGLIRNNLYESIESEHYGLYNINERLKITFGDKYSINIDSIHKKWTKVTLKIPMISEGFECLE